jgi:RNA polymerase I-specific transcription initiation factor RRN6
MTDSSLNDLNYGHFGEATYSLESSEWSFSRNPQRQELRTLTQWRTVSSAAIRYPTPNLLRPAGSVHQAVRELARDYSHFAPAVDLLPNLEIVSAATTSAVASFDASIGRLLSFGSIGCQGHYDHRPKAVVATAAGEVGSILQIQIVEKERHGWDNGMFLEGPLLNSGEITYWNEDAAPIRQICFAEVKARGTFLAVRLQRRTVILHPTYVHHRKAGNRSEFFDLPPSTIDPCLIHSITAEETGGIPHAHVAFNSEYQRQIGIVDEQGNWSIWDIDNGYRNDDYKVTCSAVGSVASSIDDASTSPGPSKSVKEDGWARMLWVGDANTVAVVTRRHMVVCNVKAGLMPLTTPRVISERSADWILDAERHPSNKKLFFILTSTRLFLVTVTPPSDDPGFVQVEPGATVLLSWTHFRGAEDITLQLCVHKSSYEGM